MIGKRCRSLGKAAAATLILFMPATARANTATANLTTQLTVTASCTITGSSLNFGTIAGTSLLTLPTNNSASFSVTCSNGSPYAVGVDYGANASGTQRRLFNGTGYINYGLFLDALFTSPWSGASTSTSCVTSGACYLGTGNGAAQLIPIYGQVPPVVLTPGPGTYSDTVVLTIDY